MKKSFFLKVFGGYTLIIIVLSAVILLFSFEKMRDFHIQSLTRDLKSVGSALRPTVKPWLENGRYNELDAAIKKLDNDIQARITVVSPTGIVLADSKENPQGMENHGNRPEIMQALVSDAGASLRYSTTVMEKMLYVAVPVSSNGKIIGIVRVSLFLKDINNFISTLKYSLVNITILAVIVSVVFASLFLRNLSKPVRMLAEASRRVAAGNFDTQIHLAQDDEFSGLAGSFNYMTERVRALFGELSQQKAELNTIISSLQDGLFVIDEKEKIILYNESFQKIAGHDIIKDKFYWEVVRAAEFSQLIRSAFSGKKSLSGEVSIGANAYLCSASYLLTKREVVVLLHDITGIRQLEKIKKDFTVNVSHELRTPLSAIKGYVETLEDSIDEKNMRYLQIVKRHTDRLTSIVEDLLSLSEMEEKECRFEQVRLDEVVVAAANVFTQKLSQKNLSLTLAVEQNLPPIRADQFRLEQMLINLIDNAIKYTEKGSVEIGVSRKDGGIEMYVRDTGIGIPGEHLGRIFERFYVVDKSRSRKLGGTGLGLSIVKHIVLLHNGAIKLDSIPGKGTTFTITLPA